VKGGRKLGRFAARTLIVFGAFRLCANAERSAQDFVEDFGRRSAGLVGTALSARLSAAIREAKSVIINMDDEANRDDMRIFLT